MATSYPTSIQDLDATRGNASDKLSSPNHADHHELEDKTIEALQAKVGADSSAVQSSIDYKLSEIAAGQKAVSKTAEQTLTNKTLGTGTKVAVGSDATGDIYYRHSDGTLKRLAAEEGKILKILDGVPTYVVETTVANASASVKGVVEIATDAEMTAGTATGSTGAILVLPATAAGSPAAYKLVQYDGTGKLPAVDQSNLTGKNAAIIVADVASDTSKFMGNSAASVSGSTYAIYREITLNEDLPATRIKINVACNSGEVYARIYKNGVAFGTERHVINNTTLFSEDFTGFISGDKIQLYARLISGTGTVNIQDLCFDRNITKLNGNTLSTPIPVTFGTNPTNSL
ncbi:MAG: hypothetical protein WCQ96_03100 [Patescibacteria group bacterium]